MKKFFAIILMLTVLSAASLTSFAQGRRYRTYNSRTYYDYRYQNRSFWDKHRDKLTVAGAAAKTVRRRGAP